MERGKFVLIFGFVLALALIASLSFVSAPHTSASLCQGQDNDGDGWPGGNNLLERCSRAHVIDCDDSDPSVHPNATEYCWDGKDTNCIGQNDSTDPVCRAIDLKWHNSSSNLSSDSEISGRFTLNKSDAYNLSLAYHDSENLGGISSFYDLESGESRPGNASDLSAPNNFFFVSIFTGDYFGRKSSISILENFSSSKVKTFDGAGYLANRSTSIDRNFVSSFSSGSSGGLHEFYGVGRIGNLVYQNLSLGYSLPDDRNGIENYSFSSQYVFRTDSSLVWPCSQGGKNITIAGQNERCFLNNQFVEERWCNASTGELVTEPMSCKADYDSDSFCHQGACTTCIDSDSNASDPHKVRGSTTDSLPLGDVRVDRCQGNNLREFYCGPSGMESTTVDCSSKGDGFVCRDGKGKCVCQSDYEMDDTTCSQDDYATYVDTSPCSGYPTKQDYCDFNNLGVIGDSFKFDSVKINGSDFDSFKNYTNTGVQEVVIERDGQKVSFDWDTSRDELNLYEIEIRVSRSSSDNGHIIVDGLDKDKRVTLDRAKGTDKVCIDDSPDANSSFGINTSTCNDPNEVYLDCPGSNGGYECNVTDLNSKYEVWPLENSLVYELDYGNYSYEVNTECKIDDWNCNPSNWSSASCINGTKTRNCTKKSGVSCSQGYQPNESISCPGGVSGDSFEDNDTDTNDTDTSDNQDDGDDSGGLPDCVEGEHYKCANSWSECHTSGELEGKQTRACTKFDDKECKGFEDVKTERDCSTGEDLDEVESESSVFGEDFPLTMVLVIGGGVIVLIVVILIIVKSGSSGGNSSSSRGARRKRAVNKKRITRRPSKGKRGVRKRNS